MVTEYRGGSISDIIAKSSGSGSVTYDSKLVNIFGGAGSSKDKPKTWRKVHVSQSKPAFALTIPKAEAAVKRTDGRKVKNKGDEILSHSDAAAIRVQAKAKYRQFNSGDGQEVRLPEFKKQRKLKRELSDESSAEEEDTIPVKKSKPKKKKIIKKLVDSSDEENAQSNVNEEEATSDVSDLKLKTKKSKLKNGSQSQPEEDAESKAKTVAELNAPKEKDAELESRTVFIGNVPKDIKKSKIKNMFKSFGEIETIRFRGATPAKPTQLKKVALRKNELHPDRSSIMAYVRFKTRAEAEKATKGMKGKEIQEHHLTVDLADSSKKRDNKRAIFIGNLHLKVEDDELWDLFKECGQIESVRVIRDGATGLGKGFGYINFESEDSVPLALKLNGHQIRNRALRISNAVKKPKQKNKSQGNRQRGPREPVSPSAEKSNAPTRAPQRPHKPKTTNFEPKRQSFTGDQLSEIGKLKRNPNKVNKGELKKARIAKQLVGVSLPSKTGVNKFKFPPRAQQKQISKQKKSTGKSKPKKKGGEAPIRYFN